MDWLWDFVFHLYGIRIPTETFFLNMPPEYALKLMENRENKITHNMKKDIHERDQNHIIESYKAACELVDKYHWYEVKCIKNNTIRTIEEIHEEIFEELMKHIK